MIVIAPKNEIVKASDYDWQNIKSIYWDYPRDEHRLEFFTGGVKYATMRARIVAPGFGFFLVVCGFENIIKTGIMDIRIEIKDKVLKELNGSIFQTKDSYFKIVRWK